MYADQLHTPRKIVRASDAQVVWLWESDPWGNGAPDESPSGLATLTYNPRLPGQVYDAETGLHYNYFRDYDPTTGRYVQSDPIGLAGGINTFGYVGGNPLKYIDPQGLVKWSCEVYAGAIIIGFGVAVYWFDLKSECVNGRYAYIRVKAWGLGSGFGARGTGGGGGVTFDDRLFDIFPDGFNGTFRVLGANAGIGLVGGWTWYQVGSNFSDVGGAPSPALGFDFSVAGVRGYSKVVSVSRKKCNCE